MNQNAAGGRPKSLHPSSFILHPRSPGLCITHLPQLAAYGDVHFHVTKHVAGERTVTQVDHLTGDERVAELARMLGADTDAGRASVLEMMQDVEELPKSAD